MTERKKVPFPWCAPESLKTRQFREDIKMIRTMNILAVGIQRASRWPDKSTTSYDMLDFQSYIKSLTRKCLVIERHMLQIQGILLQYLKFN